MLNTSSYWVNHFESNLIKQRVDWNQKPQIAETEKVEILYSIKAWQLGETSEGHNLIAAARNFSKKSNEPEYLKAIQLFIKGEQKHINTLGRYIDNIGEQRTKKEWGDNLLNLKYKLVTTSFYIYDKSFPTHALYQATNQLNSASFFGILAMFRVIRIEE